MGRRTNTAVWQEKYHRWKIDVQKDGKRRSFYSSKPGRTGQREANKKADEWLDLGVVSRRKTVGDVWPEYLARKKATTSMDNWRPMDSRWRTWIEPKIGRKRLEALTDQDLQDVLDAACAAGRSKKTLQNLLGDLTGLLKFARRSGYTSYTPSEVTRGKNDNALRTVALSTLARRELEAQRNAHRHRWTMFLPPTNNTFYNTLFLFQAAKQLVCVRARHRAAGRTAYA